MNNGINICHEDFMALPVKQQNAVLFENTETIKRMINNYKLNQKIIFAWLSAITAVGTFILVNLWESLGGK